MTGSLLFLWTIWGRVDTFFVSKLSVAYSDLYFQVEVPVMMSLYLHLILNTKVLCATSIFKEMKLYFFFCLKQFTYTQNLFLIAKLRCCKNSEFESFDAWCMLFSSCVYIQPKLLFGCRILCRARGLRVSYVWHMLDVLILISMDC